MREWGKKGRRSPLPPIETKGGRGRKRENSKFCREENLTIDSIGTGYNEGGFNVTWMKEARKQFDQAGLEHLQTIGTDDCCGGQYSIAPKMATDPELNASIDILGAHCTGTQNGQHNPSADVLVRTRVVSCLFVCV